MMEALNVTRICFCFGEGTDEPNQLHVTTKQGKMSSNTRFALNTWYAVALVNDGNIFDIIY